MFRILKNGLLSFIFTFISIEKCVSELPPSLPPPSLYLYSPGSLEYSEVLVARAGDNLTLVCELRGDKEPRRYLWNYLPDDDGVHQPLVSTPAGPTLQSSVFKSNLKVSDSGQYLCSAPPYSLRKYILVQDKGPTTCARGAFRCGARCVLPSYVCDGRADCLAHEDEDIALCGELPCHRADKLNCSSGRCVPEAACCRPAVALCQQPYCCDEHPRYTRIDGFVDVEYPALFEDRHAPEQYGFIQSTIYTVTACALIFMIAVVLLVSAICKMHMKRTALRSLAQRAPTHAPHMYGSPRFPPCYEASRLLEESRVPSAPSSHSACEPPSVGSVRVGGPPESPADTPVRTPRTPPEQLCPETQELDEQPRVLARLGAIFSSRYRQVPTNSEVEMRSVRCNSLNASPTHATRLNNYRSPTYCDLNSTDFYFTSPDTESYGRDLNYMATPVEFFRRRTTRNNPIDRILDQIDRPRPLTLQLGRFQLSIPRFGRRSSADIGRRPDTPNVAEINIDDLDFVRLNSNETYTLNGRTIRLLGANFENYPTENGAVRPPPYTEAVRCKLYGPPPEYLSRDTLNTDQNENRTVDEQAASNVEMPPRYEDLASGVDRNANTVTDNGNVTDSGNVTNTDTDTNTDNVTNNDNVTITGSVTNNGNGDAITDVIDNLPAIDSDCNANERIGCNGNGDVVHGY